jgi:endonuclease YncB( thermonuclease family)
MATVPFRYNHAHASRIVDGDTFDCNVRITPTLMAHRRIRIRGIDAPEIRTRDEETKRRGLYSKSCLEQLLRNPDVVLDLHGTDNWGRWVCDVGTEDWTDLARALVAMGAAVPRPRRHTRSEAGKEIYATGDIDTRYDMDVNYDDYDNCTALNEPE